MPPVMVTGLNTLFPELTTVALPKFVAAPTPLLVPELVAVASPPIPFVTAITDSALVPELVVVAFWFAPSALLRRKGALPELVQLMSLGVVVHMNCAEAGELAKSAMAET